MKSSIVFSLLFISTIIFNGCATPGSFIQTMQPGWATIEIRDGVTYDKSWATVYDLLSRTFDIEIAQKENGYIRTNWIYTWTGRYTDYYRVRVTVKFPEDHNSVDVKSEAYYKEYIGYDTRLLETLKTDIMGSVGRTTR